MLVTDRKTWFAALALAVILAAIYGPAIGHGFMKDDFRWIAAADVQSPGDLHRVFTTNVGFYRPLVTTSFAIDRVVWGLDARGYALTNAVLLTADAVLLMLLARRLSLPPPAALFAAAVWVFNFHGINMALLWISGRTTLLLCLFALAATLAVLRGHRLAAGLLTLGAMLSKEEAVMLPLLLVAVDVSSTHARHAAGRAALTRSWPLWTALGVYALLRNQSGAFGFSDAPDYYRLTFDPAAVSKNLVQYLDRGATAALFAAAVVWHAITASSNRRISRCNRWPRCGRPRASTRMCTTSSWSTHRTRR